VSVDGSIGVAIPATASSTQTPPSLRLGVPIVLPQHPAEHRSQHPILLAVDQQGLLVRPSRTSELA
jgi:hypothetical protein